MNKNKIDVLKNLKYLMFMIYIFILIINILLNSYTVIAHPLLPTEFYGTVKFYNTNASSGLITAYSGNTICGSFNVVNAGFYGVLSCLGVDTDNSNSSGAMESQVITFRYNDNPATATGDTIFTSGTFKFVNITFPKVFCGDGFCDSLENCFDCELDCNACNFTGNVTQNSTSNSTSNQTTPGDSTSGGGGSGGSGGSGGGGGSGGATSGFEDSTYPCMESWSCFNWSECSILGIRNRSCVDINNCGSYNSKPKEIEECNYLGNCFDNLINCHNNSCEEGVDCGGPCEKKCSSLEQPSSDVIVKLPRLEFPKTVCERHIDLGNFALWFFLIIIFLAIVIRVVFTKYYISNLYKSDKVTPLVRAKNIRSVKRKTLLFIITLISLTIVALLYSYYFLLCPSDFFKYSWMLLFALILIPLIIHAVMIRFEYSESKHISKNKKLDDVHYQNLVKMIELENNMLADEENAIANKLYELSKKEEFKNLLENDANIKNIYKNLVRLYTEYKEKKNPFNIEKNICDDIDALEFDAVFKSAIEKHPELKHVFERLKKLYIHYGEKQKMYDKLDEIEQIDAKNKMESSSEKY
jgi:uncharacterized membrane protein YgcG